MKLVNKKDLTYKFGFFFDKDNEVVEPSSHVAYLLNELEEEYQKAKYLNAQPEAQPVPSLEGFEREREDSVKFIRVEAKTPILDKKIEESLALMKEIDNTNKAEKYNKKVRRYMDVFRFVSNDEFIACDTHAPKLDLPTIGNPLELDEIKIADIINYIIFGKHIEEDED